MISNVCFIPHYCCVMTVSQAWMETSVKHLGCSFSRRFLTTFSRWLILQKSPALMLEWVYNTPFVYFIYFLSLATFCLLIMSHLSFVFTQILNRLTSLRDGSRAAATSKMERFVIKVNGFQPLTIITKRSILVFAAALDPPLSLKII